MPRLKVRRSEARHTMWALAWRRRFTMYILKVIALKQQRNKEIELFTATKQLKKREMKLFLKHNAMISDLQNAIVYKKHIRPHANEKGE